MPTNLGAVVSSSRYVYVCVCVFVHCVRRCAHVRTLMCFTSLPLYGTHCVCVCVLLWCCNTKAGELSRVENIMRTDLNTDAGRHTIERISLALERRKQALQAVEGVIPCIVPVFCCAMCMCGVERAGVVV